MKIIAKQKNKNFRVVFLSFYDFEEQKVLDVLWELVNCEIWKNSYNSKKKKNYLFVKIYNENE